MHRNRKIALLLLTVHVLLLSACASQKEIARRQAQTQIQNQAKQAFQQFSNGDFSTAASTYQNLAANPAIAANDRNNFLLLSAESHLLAGENNEAKQDAGQILTQDLSASQLSRLELVQGELLLKSGKPDEALQAFNNVQAEQLTADKRIKLHRFRIAAYSQQGDLNNSTLERIALARLLQITESHDNTTAILDSLLLLPQPELQQMQTSPNADVAAWADLTALIREQAQQPGLLSQSFQTWQSQHPSLPVDISFLDQYALSFKDSMQPPEMVAVLLPESGPYADAAMAIRRGILTSYYHNRAETDWQPAIRFYDSEDGEPYALYQQAIADGADFVVGPLNKDKLQTLSESGDLPVPVLALNEIPGLTKPNLFQFSLRPEDDVEQAASSAWFDGHQNALILVPANEYGDRIAQHFSLYWEQLDGKVIETAQYITGQSDFSDSIKALLNLDDSEARYQALRKVVPSLKFEPTARDDADFIFLLAKSSDARMLRPQLQFYRAGGLPVYATSQVYAGRPNPQLDRDLSDIIFCDIPWLFDVAGSGENLPDSIATQQTWVNLPDGFLRLTALGLDSYKLIPHLRRLQNLPDSSYSGSSGTLTLSRENHVKRQLFCAQFIDGVAESRGWAPHLQPSKEEYPEAEATPVYEP